MHSGNFPKAKAKIFFSFDFVLFFTLTLARHGNTLPLLGFASVFQSFLKISCRKYIIPPSLYPFSTFYFIWHLNSQGAAMYCCSSEEGRQQSVRTCQQSPALLRQMCHGRRQGGTRRHSPPYCCCNIVLCHLCCPLSREAYGSSRQTCGLDLIKTARKKNMT